MRCQTQHVGKSVVFRKCCGTVGSLGLTRYVPRAPVSHGSSERSQLRRDVERKGVPADPTNLGKKTNATAFLRWRRLGGQTTGSTCLRRVQFGAVQFVVGVAAASVDYVAVVEHGGGVARARVAHAAGRGPCAGGWIIEFGAGERRLRG
jgi:hypothetical protein